MAATPPQIEYDAAKEMADNLYDTVQSIGDDRGLPGWLTQFVGGAVAGLVLCVAPWIVLVLQVGIALGSWVGASFLEALATAKDENADGINNVLAESVNEMLGTNLSGSQLSSGSGSASGMDTNQQIGDQLLKIFEAAFGGGGTVTPEQGAANARTFAGFAVSFATSQGFLSILAEAASLGFLKEFHELPDSVRDGLGLGRLSRLALQPLIQNAVQLPYQQYCRKLFRPTQLNEGQLVKALHAGTLPDSQVRDLLAQLGYSDDLIDFVIEDNEAKLGLSELITLLDNGDITEQDVTNNLTLTGMPPDEAKRQITAAHEAAAKGQWTALLSELETAYVAGYVDESTFNNVLSKMPLSDDELEAFRQKVGFKLEVPRKTLSLSEVESAVVSNVVDFSYFDSWMQNEGYDPKAQDVLYFQLLQKITAAADKEAAKVWRRQQLQKKGKPVPPWLEG